MFVIYQIVFNSQSENVGSIFLMNLENFPYSSNTIQSIKLTKIVSCPKKLLVKLQEIKLQSRAHSSSLHTEDKPIHEITSIGMLPEKVKS